MASLFIVLTNSTTNPYILILKERKIGMLNEVWLKTEILNLECWVILDLQYHFIKVREKNIFLQCMFGFLLMSLSNCLFLGFCALILICNSLLNDLKSINQLYYYLLANLNCFTMRPFIIRVILISVSLMVLPVNYY